MLIPNHFSDRTRKILGCVVVILVMFVFPVSLVVILFITGVIPKDIWPLFINLAIWVPLIAFVIYAIIAGGKRNKENQRISNEGLPALAKVIKIKEGEDKRGDYILKRLWVEVNHPESGQYTAEIWTRIPKINTDDYIPGKIINVKIDKLDKNKVTIV